MPGDKLKRVKSVKRWLDKAENSYSNNKDISGELNLMMAQAEMQRLKETHPHEKAKKWGIRLSAMAAAAVLFIGFSNLFSANADKSPVISRETTVSKEEVPKVPEVPEDMFVEAVKIWCFQKRYSRPWRQLNHLIRIRYRRKVYRRKRLRLYFPLCRKVRFKA